MAHSNVLLPLSNRRSGWLNARRRKAKAMVVRHRKLSCAHQNFKSLKEVICMAVPAASKGCGVQVPTRKRKDADTEPDEGTEDDDE
jgi:hypothetical protein